MNDPKTIERIMDRLYEPSEVCNCEEPCESERDHKDKAEAAYERFCDAEFERMREDRDA